MKNLKSALSLLALSLGLILTGCNDDYIAPSQNHAPAASESDANARIGDITSGQENNLPIVTVTKNNFAGTTGWRITWKGGSWDTQTVHKVQSVFSTVNGAINSVHFLNNTSWGNTDNADMQLFFGELKATSQVSQLTNKTALKNTSFKLASWSVATLEDAAKNHPANFAIGFELGAGAKVLVTPKYQAGQIYLFKTDRPTPKYGAVRIVKQGGGETIIEVVVQK